MIALLPLKLDDDKLERVRRNLSDAIAELQRVPGASAKIIRDIVLADGVATPIAHGMGKAVFVTHTPPRGPNSAGYIEEIRDGSYDRTKYVVLKANDYGGSVTVDLEVKPL